MVEKFKALENSLKSNHDKLMRVLEKLREGDISSEDAISELAKITEERAVLDRKIKAVVTEN